MSQGSTEVPMHGERRQMAGGARRLALAAGGLLLFHTAFPGVTLLRSGRNRNGLGAASPLFVVSSAKTLSPLAVLAASRKRHMVIAPIPGTNRLLIAERTRMAVTAFRVLSFPGFELSSRRELPWMICSDTLNVGPAQYPLHVGPGGVAWLTGYRQGARARPELHAVNLQTGRRLAAYKIPRGFGIARVYPVEGGAVVMANAEHLRLLLLRVNGGAELLLTPPHIKGLFSLSGVGFELSGVTSGGAHMVQISLARSMRTAKVEQTPLSLPAGSGALLGYAMLSSKVGVALLGGDAAGTRRLVFVRIAGGRVLRAVAVHFSADQITALRGRLYLFSVAGRRDTLKSCGREKRGGVT